LAAPPEFYADENTVTGSVRSLLTGLGYVLPSNEAISTAMRLANCDVCAKPT